MEHRHHGGGIPPGLHHTIFSLSVLPACRDSKAVMFESSIAQMKEFRAPFSFTNRFPVIPAKFRLRPSIAMPDKPQPNGCFGNLSRFPKSLSSTFSAPPIFGPGLFEPDPDLGCDCPPHRELFLMFGLYKFAARPILRRCRKYRELGSKRECFRYAITTFRSVGFRNESSSGYPGSG